MRKYAPAIIALAGGAIAFGVLSYFNPGDGGLYCVYDSKLRTPLFTGFLTIGGFLLTLKTFVLIKLKEEVYESPWYRDKIDRNRKLNPKLTLYGPLNRLGSLLIFCVFAALSTAVAQLSVGFIPNRFASAFCISLAVGSLILVFCAWFYIWRNLTYWFELLHNTDAKRTAESTPVSTTGP
ncbi:MAG: hypothetical protein AABM67_03620 [Acidobacteriota bacterium]